MQESEPTVKTEASQREIEDARLRAVLHMLEPYGNSEDVVRATEAVARIAAKAMRRR